MWEAIKELFDSKKFVAALFGVVSAVLVKVGIPETSVVEVFGLLSPILVYIGAQGFADLGKEKAFVDAVAAEEAEERINRTVVVNNKAPDVVT